MKDRRLARVAATLVMIAAIAMPAAAAELATTTVTTRVLPLERWFDGTVEAVHHSTVSAETSGRVQEILFEVGDEVPAGAVVLKLVSTEQRQAFLDAEASLAEARSNLEVEASNYQRVREIYARQLISKADFDRASASHETARARVARAEAALETAGERLSYTEVKAPYGGVVSARLVELGEAVQPGTPLMSGFDPRSMRVETDLPQSVAARVREHRRARVAVADAEFVEPERITLFPVADPATSTVHVRLDLPQDATGLYPGQFTRVGFTIGERPRLLVDARSVVYRSEVTAVYVLTDSGPQLRQVRLGNRFGGEIEVLAGLEQGDTVARDPVAATIEAARGN